ncbi:MAG: isoprenylcysteine carboxylmethyltransferase family protein [Verrucomicrobiota bacterium]|jgi:protein-S-isoprenylcysteine O-methyltransferase Ste14
MATIAISIIIGCWLIFLGYWAISAFGQKPTAERKSWLSSFPHRILYGTGITLFIYPRLPKPWNLAVTPQTDWARVLGMVICVLGLIVTIWARRTLAGNWSNDVTFKQGHELIKTGPYRYVRHPIYTGILVMFLGTAVDVGLLRCWVGLLVVGISFWIKLKQEETLMLQHFPDTYPAYRKQVKALVPFLI